ncbi:MAG: hypothetical protein KF764_25410 [Labilithrix sp.]|nr:hypothetical protein [Labilithrix sp.]
MATKTHALTIRFSALEAAALDALAKEEDSSAAEVVRKATLTHARDVLSDEAWERVVSTAGAPPSWRAWEPPLRPRLASLQAYQSTTLGLTSGTAESLRAEIRAVNQRVDQLVSILGGALPGREVRNLVEVDWEALARELRIEPEVIDRFRLDRSSGAAVGAVDWEALALELRIEPEVIDRFRVKKSSRARTKGRRSA